MAIFQGLCSSFKLELLEAGHNFLTDTFMMALYTSAADLSQSTLIYSSTNEATGGDYIPGGQVLTGVSVTLVGTTAVVAFANPSWTGSITARGALIYNSSKANKAVAVLDFGADKTSTTVFTVQVPAAGANTAIVRIE